MRDAECFFSRPKRLVRVLKDRKTRENFIKPPVDRLGKTKRRYAPLGGYVQALHNFKKWEA
jgi:hypothetical protein